MKRLFCAFFALFLLIMPLGVSAQRCEQYIFDMTGLLDEMSEEDGREIVDLIFEARDEYGIFVGVLFVDSLDGRDEVFYADDFYDENIGAEHGILLLYSVEDNIRYVSTSGKCIDPIDLSLSDISEAISPHFETGDYVEAVKAYIIAVNDIMETEKNIDVFVPIMLSVVIGLGVAFLVTASMKAQLNGAKHNPRAEEYLKKDSLKISVSRDLYLYSTVSRVAKQKNDSSTHKSSSGRTHGGGRV